MPLRRKSENPVRDILGDWYGLTNGALLALERRGVEHLAPGQLKKIRRERWRRWPTNGAHRPRRWPGSSRAFGSRLSACSARSPGADGRPGGGSIATRSMGRSRLRRSKSGSSLRSAGSRSRRPPARDASRLVLGLACAAIGGRAGLGILRGAVRLAGARPALGNGLELAKAGRHAQRPGAAQRAQRVG